MSEEAESKNGGRVEKVGGRGGGGRRDRKECNTSGVVYSIGR